MKMNKIKYAIISAAFVLGGMATGCDTLDIDNLNSYDESMVWDDVNLATAYVNNLYSECFGNWSAGADNNSEQVTGIPWYLGTITETGGAYKKWNYTTIRHINEAIKRLEEGVLDSKTANGLLGQAYFMRALLDGFASWWCPLYKGSSRQGYG